MTPTIKTEPRVTSIAFKGPIPPPAILEGYEKICPGAADRILKMAEKQANHRQEQEGRMVDSVLKNESRGMKYSFWITIILIVVGLTLVLMNKEGLIAYLALFGPAIFHAGNYIYHQRGDKKKDDDEERNNDV